MDKRISLRKSDLGFSLVELLVATAITLISLLIIVQVFSVYDGWKRTTTGTAQSQENGLLAAFSIERDLRSAGFGMVGLGCSTINAYNAGLVAPPISATGLPVTITPDVPPAGTNQRINILYSSSPFGNIAARLQADMPDSDRTLRVNNGVGFNQGDMIILFEPPRDCSILQLSQDAQATGVPNVTGPGTSWDLPHAPVGPNGIAYPWNPPLNPANILFAAPGYTLAGGAQVLNLGQLVDRSYYVENNMLRMDERNLDDGSLTTFDLIPGVIGLRARYGRDINDNGVLEPVEFDNITQGLIAKGVGGNNTLFAVQISLIVRSGNWERNEVSPAAIAYWPPDANNPNPPTRAIAPDDRHYRYRVFQTVVPLKNMIWNN
jgi:type IV pilus assembly protein PilW